MATLYDAALREGSPSAATLALCLVTLALPFEVVSMDLERVDWRRGSVQVPTRRGHLRTVALSGVALQLIQRISGSAKGSGQIVTAGRGARLPSRYVRLDRLYDRLGDAAPETLMVEEWNFHGIRTAACEILTQHGSSPIEVTAFLGHRRRDGSSCVPREDFNAALVAAERWARLLLPTSYERQGQPQRAM